MTDIRPQLSRRNPYWIDRHRYYELKHFCLQYNTWKENLRNIYGIPNPNFPRVGFSQKVSDPVLWSVELREEYRNKIHMVEDAALLASPELSVYILKAVTEGLAYENLHLIHGLPCGREMWYELYRKFFYILHRSRK